MGDARASRGARAPAAARPRARRRCPRRTPSGRSRRRRRRRPREAPATARVPAAPSSRRPRARAMITLAIAAFCSSALASGGSRASRIRAVSEATCTPISRTTVRIVPSTGSRTDPYAWSAARASAALIRTGSTSSPGRLASSSAAPRISCERITPEFPRAPSSAARATEATISSRPTRSIVPSGGRREAVELLDDRAQRQHHVVAGVAVGDREHVDLVDLFAARLERRQPRLEHGAEPEQARSKPGAGADSGPTRWSGRGSGPAREPEPLRSLELLRPCRPSGTGCTRTPAAASRCRRSGPAGGSGRSAAWWRPSSGCGCCRTPDPSCIRDIPWPWRASIASAAPRNRAVPNPRAKRAEATPSAAGPNMARATVSGKVRILWSRVMRRFDG